MRKHLLKWPKSSTKRVAKCALEEETVHTKQHKKQFRAWHDQFDEVDILAELTKNPIYTSILGDLSGSGRVVNAVGNSFSRTLNCMINFLVEDEDKKENKDSKM